MTGQRIDPIIKAALVTIIVSAAIGFVGVYAGLGGKNTGITNQLSQSNTQET